MITFNSCKEKNWLITLKRPFNIIPRETGTSTDLVRTKYDRPIPSTLDTLREKNFMISKCIIFPDNIHLIIFRHSYRCTF